MSNLDFFFRRVPLRSTFRQLARGTAFAVVFLLPVAALAQTVVVDVDPTVEHQVIDGFGANQPQYYFATDYFGGAMLDLAFKRSGMGMTLLRCDMPFGFEGKQGTSAGNDNADPDVIDWAGFDTSVLAPVAAVAQGAAARGCDKFVASPWSPPYWMKSNQDEQNGGSFVSGMEPELAEYFRAFLTYMANGTGEVDPPVHFDHVTLQNEPDISAYGWHCGYTQSQLTYAMQFVGDMLATYFPSTTMAAADNSNTGQTVSYLTTIMADGVVAPMVGIYSVHPYNLNNYPGGITRGNWTNPDSKASIWSSYRTSTESLGYDRRSWMVEHCDHDDVNNPDLARASWTSGLDGATHIHHALVSGNLSAWSFWTLFRRNADLSGGGYGHALWYSEDADGNSTLKSTGKVSAFTPFYRYVRPGYVRVDATPSDASTDLRVTAYKAPGGVNDGLVIVVINRGGADVDLDATISDAGSIATLHRCEATEYGGGRATPHGVHGGEPVTLSGGFFSATVPAQSVTAFVHEAGAVWPRAFFDFDGTDLSGSFDASASAPATVDRYEWDFGDGSAGEGVSPTHDYATTGTYDVILTVTDLQGGVDTVTESVTVGTDRAISGSIRYYRNSAGYEPGDAMVGDATVSLTGDTATETTTSDTADGSYAFSSLPLENITVTPTKDGDFEGISSLDAAVVSQARVGMIVLTAHQEIAGDVSGNGDITSYDAALISQFRVGIITQFPIATTTGHDWVFVPASRSYVPLAAHRSGEDYLGILYGDVTGNWVPTGRSGQAVLPVSASDRRGTTAAGRADEPPEPSAEPGRCWLALRGTPESEVGRSVTRWTLTAEGCRGLIGLDLDLAFDPDGVEILGTLATGPAAEFTLASGSHAGVLRLALYGADPLLEDGDLLVFWAESGASGPRPPAISIDRAEANEGKIPVFVRKSPSLGRGPGSALNRQRAGEPGAALETNTPGSREGVR